jgi:hypothetical protein
MSSPLLSLFDRTVPVFIKDEPKGFPSARLKGKKAVIVSACATPWPWNVISAESRGAVREIWKGILKFAGYELIGKVVQPGRRATLWFDDVFYGKKLASGKAPVWIPRSAAGD